ncbi:MAG: aquaporin family protein [Gluconacetobacter diazotrophicus]|nr:aquaporin family protein [Gluconacetobacter diazotrophicus]
MPDGTPPAPLTRRLLSEALGSAILFGTVIGSGVMGQRLSPGNAAVALLGNTLATGAILFVLVTVLAPISGAHMNPAVSLVAVLRRDLSRHDLLPYVAVQLAGGLVGVWIAHAMFAMPIMELSTRARTGPGQWLGEFVASFGLILCIIGTVRFRPAAVAATVALYITAAYWFTSSTSFANPAITIARSLSDSFAGIRPADVPAFVLAQIAGALCGSAASTRLFPDAPV